jgi:hypothetical protein
MKKIYEFTLGPESDWELIIEAMRHYYNSGLLDELECDTITIEEYHAKRTRLKVIKARFNRLQKREGGK